MYLFIYFNTVCASLNGSYCGVDLHNDTTPDFTKTGRYSAHIFAEEAIRKINIQVGMTVEQLVHKT